MKDKGVAVIGSTTIDTIVKNDSTRYLKLGGVTAYSGITYNRHGIHTHVVTNVAPEDSHILNILRNKDIGVCNGPTRATTRFVNHINADKGRQQINSKAKAIGLSQIMEVLDLVECIHLGPLHPLDIEIAALLPLKDTQLPIYLDIQGYVRYTRNKTVYPAVAEHLADALYASQIVKANELEMETILRHYHMDLTGLMTRYNIDEFIVSRGGKGGGVTTISGEEIAYEAAPIRMIDDNTGAGDVFFAAYLVARIFKEKNVRNACTHAAGLAAQQVEGVYIRPAELRLKPR
jgi:sugar/nucleoside kinase (ribokinase family)